MTLSTVYDIILSGCDDKRKIIIIIIKCKKNPNQNIPLFVKSSHSTTAVLITPLPMAQESNPVIVSDTSQILTLAVNFFFSSFLISWIFLTLPLTSFTFTDSMKTGKQIFFSFEHSKNIPKTSTLKCHHNKIHELYSSFFFLFFFSESCSFESIVLRRCSVEV